MVPVFDDLEELEPRGGGFPEKGTAGKSTLARGLLPSKAPGDGHVAQICLGPPVVPFLYQLFWLGGFPY